MKKIVRTLCLVAMVALVATSCKKKEEEVTELTLTMEEVQGFQAGPSFDGSKIYLDPNAGYAPRWNANDAVMVYNLASDGNSTCEEFTATAASEGQPNATFYGNNIGAKKDLGYFVFFNADKATREILNNNDNLETFKVLPNQTYDPAYLIDRSALVLASPAESSTGESFNFNLQHIFGILNVAIADNLGNGGNKVNKIVVRDDFNNITGTLDLKLNEVNPAEFTRLMNLLETNQTTYAAQLSNYLNTLGYHASGDIEPLGKEITLNCKDFALPYRAWQYFFIPVRPGAFYHGFTVEIEFTGDAQNITKHFDADMNNLVKPGWFINKYFTTANGFLQ
jgi:hypothetical protein